MHERLRPLLTAAYPIALFMVAYPLLNLLLTMWPARFDLTSWRFGAYGLLMGTTMMPFIGLAVAAGAAWLLGHYRALRVMGVVAGVAMVTIIVGYVVFFADAGTVKAALRPEALDRYNASVMRAAIIGAANVFVLGWFAVGAWRATTPQPSGNAG
jgi:hypothetical protein